MFVLVNSDMMENSVCDKHDLNSSNKSYEMIRPINAETVHKICSGQVVLSLAIAVKELVENSIDGEANIIDIRLKEYGSELLEVSDNGIGICKENFQAVTLKHYTSKIREFSDLEKVATLGFRGEALSSLCALSDLTIITRHRTAEAATKICYDRNGSVVTQSTTARQNGTTVILENLFSTLPVRRKEFLKNLKREFNKMCQLLYAYCMVSKGIKFTCTNITTKGSKSTIVSTEGHKTVRANIINIFGVSQLASLVDIDMITPDESVLKEYGVTLTEADDLPFTFEFLISSVVHGSGRSSTDRQFYFVNSRPCEPSKVIKLVNEIYKQFNAKQYPFVYLNVTTKTSLIDVNITPDKRQVFIEQEKILLAVIKTSLLEAFKQFPCTFKIQNVDVSQTLLNSSKSKKTLKRSFTDTDIKSSNIIERFKKRSKSYDTSSKTNLRKLEINSMEHQVEEEAERNLTSLIEIACKLIKESDSEKIVDECCVDKQISNTSSVSVEHTCVVDDMEIKTDMPMEEISHKKCMIIKADLGNIKRSLNERMTQTHEKVDKKIKFRSEINPESNHIAEDELQKQISKSDFHKMEIIGQFNLGFIISKLNDDLFIIDQHATDEKYNYEKLQCSTTIESQVLVSPQLLELTAASECLLIENEHIFRKNGFAFKFDITAPCTRKVALTAVPLSQKFVFGKSDIDEMLFMLQDASHTMCRPSRIQAMFASRACRKSVMIGKSLSKSDMRRLIDHMAEIAQPWNCPHGRPTMRHLINLSLIHN